MSWDIFLTLRTQGTQKNIEWQLRINYQITIYHSLITNQKKCEYSNSAEHQ